VNSWLGGETKAVAVETVESALGRDTISNIANRAGISFSTAASAIAMLLPKLIQRLAPGGAIPSRLAPEIASYISGPTAAMATGARHAAAYSGTMARSPGIGRYLWPLFALAILGGLLLWLANRGTPTVNRAVFNIEEQARLASQRAVNALTALRPGYTVQEFLQAVNLNVINFATGSASVPAESYDVLNRAATALKSAPAGTPIEIGGHTDNTGNAAANLQLSQQRAEAVRAYLIQQGVDGSTLTARGYGDTRPVASNDTDEGRFRNRRIEFAAR
jgi:outer membrane protein OmpA-like peptidoglycan-associated protein